MFDKFKKRLVEMENGGEELTFKPWAEEEKKDEPVKEGYETAVAVNTKNDEREAANVELKVMRPESYEEVSDVADHLLAGCTVVLNLELLDMKATIRMLDFLNGVTYSTGGEIKNVSKTTFIITPHNVDVSDD